MMNFGQADDEDLDDVDDDGAVCSGCGCSYAHPCVFEDGTTCIWATPDLCSACARQK